MANRKKQWSDFTPVQQKTVVAAGAVELVLTAVALRDLTGRTAAQIRGPKAAWMLSLAVQPVGPIAYLLIGRRSA